MSEENKSPRTLEVVHQEYSQICARAGHLSYQLHVTKSDLDILYAQLRELNLEAAALQAKDKKEEPKNA